jgi:hypothetical protein
MSPPGFGARESAGSGPVSVPPFAVISGAQVQHALAGREKQLTELVEATYRLHAAGASVNPPSYFLRFPDRPSARIIALPASIGGPVRVAGKPKKDVASEESAAVRAENRRLKAEAAKLEARNEKLVGEPGKTRTALDIVGKAFALLEKI